MIWIVLHYLDGAPVWVNMNNIIHYRAESDGKTMMISVSGYAFWVAEVPAVISDKMADQRIIQ